MARIEMENLKIWQKEIPVSEGISELFLTGHSTASEVSDFEKAKREFLELTSRGVEWISVTVFRPSVEPLSDGLVDVFKTFAPTAVLWGRGGVGFSFSATGYAFASEDAKTKAFERFKTKAWAAGSVLKTPFFTFTSLDAVTSDAKGFGAQVESFYDSVAEVMRARKLAPRDFVRSWNFIDSILSRYAKFNEVRDARFGKFGITKEEAPAGTGIDCVMNGSLMAGFAEFRSAGTESAPKINRYKTSSQCEASSYGPKFSRAVSIEEGEWRRVHVSGTASVSSDGKTLNASSIRANVAHAMETVRELLDISGADFSHVVRSYAYCKKPEFAADFEDWKKANSTSDFPVAHNVCDVCRDDWLFEFECVALVPVKKGSFVLFWNGDDAIGNKSENCRILAKNGFPVPISLAMTGESARKIKLSETEKDRFFQAAFQAFGPDAVSKRFAVRSSSCSEDSASDSKAGAFRSLLDVAFDDLAEAVDSVRKSLENVETETLVPRAWKKWKLPPADFWVLVQEYVPLKTFGVTFTCDPEFSRHAMVAEVSRGAGEALVSGKNLPDRVAFSRRAPLAGLSLRIQKKSPASDVDWESWRNRFRRIESVFGRPQDVEWGIAVDGASYVFQSRPITTLAESDFALLKEFDRHEVENASVGCRLVRNELSDVFDEPTSAELDFLVTLYRSEAVVSAYARWGISYVPGNFLRTVAGKSFIDPVLERRCFEAVEFTNPFVRFWRKSCNFWRLGSVGSSLVYGKKDRLEDLENRMFEALDAAVSAVESKKKPDREEFLNLVYAPVFEANFLASSIAKYVKKNPEGFHSEYVPKDPEPWRTLFARVAKAELVGNSLAFGDASRFSTPLTGSDRFADPSSEGAAAWLMLDFLREAGRTVSVICSNLFRPTSKTVYGHSRCPSEIRFPMLDVEVVSSVAWNVLSDGEAVGRFVTLADIGAENPEPTVVFVERLLPSLVDTLPKNVVAVVSRNGGRLSHFAIVARERGLPTFVSPSLRISDFIGRSVAVSGGGMKIDAEAELPVWEESTDAVSVPISR